MKKRSAIDANLGFSLVEIAIVLVIISVLVTIISVPLATQAEQRRVEETLKQLETIKESLIGFASAKGRLPCPATLTSLGQESFCTSAAGGCVATTIEQSHGRCESNVAFVPAVTLGISPVDSSGFAVDAWALPQNRIRYAVANTSITAGTPPSCTIAAAYVLTSSATGMRTATMGCLADNTVDLVTNKPLVPLLTVCAVTPTGAAGVATGCTAPLATRAPFVLISLGKNASTGGTDIHEAHNVDADSYFVSHTPTPAGSTSGEFDDIVAWGSMNTLFARMVQAGKLP